MATSWSISVRRRAVTASTRRPSARRQREPDLAPVAPVRPAPYQTLPHQPVAHPRDRRRRHAHRIGQRGHALRAREASTTSERYWVRVTSSATSASERAAIATSTRLAVRTASTS